VLTRSRTATATKGLIGALGAALVAAGVAYGIATTPRAGVAQPKQLTVGGAQSYIDYLQRSAVSESAQPRQLTVAGARSYIDYLRPRVSIAAQPVGVVHNVSRVIGSSVTPVEGTR
jgi:hypothetical protein